MVTFTAGNEGGTSLAVREQRSVRIAAAFNTSGYTLGADVFTAAVQDRAGIWWTQGLILGDCDDAHRSHNISFHQGTVLP